MSSEGCRCRLATNVIWKAVPGSRTCIREGPLAELGKCTQHDVSFDALPASDRQMQMLPTTKWCSSLAEHDKK